MPEVFGTFSDSLGDLTPEQSEGVASKVHDAAQGDVVEGSVPQSSSASPDDSIEIIPIYSEPGNVVYTINISGYSGHLNDFEESNFAQGDGFDELVDE